MEEIVAVKLVPEKKGVPSVTGTDADDDNHVLIYIQNLEMWSSFPCV